MSRSDAARPFRIDIPQADLDELRDRLQRTRWPEEVPGEPWSMGTDLVYLKALVAYWATQYDWRDHEAELNKLPQFTAEVDGVTIHFVHVKGKGQNPTPLLLTHGWPDSFLRFSRAIPLLTDPAAHGGQTGQAFDVVVPSVPGFGFSDKTPLSSSRIADLWVKLMTEVLGYDTFMAGGGDVGGPVTLALARLYPEQVSGIHVTDAGYPTGQEEDLSELEQKYAEYIQDWWMGQGGYAVVQSTKPQSVGVALDDSPAGLAAWMLSIIDSVAAKHDVEGAFADRDTLLTNCTLYWFTRTATSAARWYWAQGQAAWESVGAPESPARSEVPTAFALAPVGPPTPREWVERHTRLVRFMEMPRGGHFLALEEPELYAQDLRAFAEELQTAGVR